MPTWSNEKNPSYLFADDPPPKSEPKQQTSPLLEDLLDWLLNRWTHTTITARDIARLGPYILRSDRRAILDLTEILVRQGWLIPLKPCRKDQREWKVALWLSVAERRNNIRRPSSFPNFGRGRHFCRGQLLPADGSMRNDARRANPCNYYIVSPPPRHLASGDAFVTIRPLMFAPAQRVIQI